MTTRVLVPYVMTQLAGVRRVLAAGLPLLRRAPGVELTYAELCANDADMDAMLRSGVPVERGIGVRGPSALSTRRGLGRALDLAAHAPRFSRIAARLARRLPEYDVCWVHGHRELLVAAAARTLARGRGPAIVWHWHGPPLTLEADAVRSASARWLTRVAARSCARVIAISEFSAAQAREMGASSARIVTVLNAASVNRDAAADGPALPARAPGQVTLLVACAALRRHKGVHVAVEALARLPARYVLWVTGDVADPVAGEYVRELEALAARGGVSERVRFVGARGDVHRVMAAADVVLVPSVWDEPFGLVAAEAQLLGVPVIASNRGALPELMGRGEHGALFAAGDAESLAAEVARLGEDPGLRARLSESARRHALAHYAYSRWTREIASVLEDAALDRSALTPDERDAPSRDCPSPRLAPSRRP